MANAPTDAWILNLKEKRRFPTLGTLLRKHYIMDIERPVVLGRNESNECQNRNSILSFYVDQHKCQAYVLGKQDEEREENNWRFHEITPWATASASSSMMSRSSSSSACTSSAATPPRWCTARRRWPTPSCLCSIWTRSSSRTRPPAKSSARHCLCFERKRNRSMEQLRHLETGSTDPAYNLAFEEYVRRLRVTTTFWWRVVRCPAQRSVSTKSDSAPRHAAVWLRP